MIKICRNRKLDIAIRELEISIDYWSDRAKEGWKEDYSRYVTLRQSVVRRMEKLKNKKI